MAGLMGGGGAVEMNPEDVARVRANLSRFDRNLAAGMKVEGAAWGRLLEVALGRAARGARAPQTRRFADAASVEESDTAGAVVVISGDGAGFYNSSAVLQATEHGSDLACFSAPRGGEYWIAPTVRESESLALASCQKTTGVLVARCNAGG